MQTERVVQALSGFSEIYLVEILGDVTGFECRKCHVLALDNTRLHRAPGLASILEHLDEHAKAGHNGARDAIGKLERCEPCRGSGMRDMSKGERCAECGGVGKNKVGRDRGVRRGVVVS